MPDTVLKTSLSSFCVARVASDDVVHYVEAVYWRGCPLPYRRSDPSALGCGELSTYVLSPPAVRPWEPGVYYRLPQVAWEAVGSRDPLALIPLDIEIEHSPFGEADERVYTSHMSYGAHTVCGLFPAETAAKWASLPPEKWYGLHLVGFRRPDGLSVGWLDALAPGAVRLSRGEPLLPHAVEVSRETV